MAAWKDAVGTAQNTARASQRQSAVVVCPTTLEDILDNDLTWELEIARRKKRWKLKEIELRAEKVRHSQKLNECLAVLSLE